MSAITKGQVFLSNINAKLIILLIFIIPLTTAGSSVLSIIILLCWILIADFKNDWKLIHRNPVAMAGLFIFVLHIVGLLWTEDMVWGLHVLKKSVKFIFISIFMLYVRESYIKYYIAAFISSIMLSELFSYGIWFEIISPIKKSSIDNPTAFVTHIIYNPFLSLAIYIMLYKVFIENKKITWVKFVNVFFIITMTINMFITGGRSGYVGFLVLIFLFIYQYFHGQIIKVMIFTLIISSGIFGSAYMTSNIFNSRVDQTINSVIHFHEIKNTSVGRRFVMAINGLEVFLNHPFIGVGTGDSPVEISKINLVNSPEVRMSKNLHNMYITEMVQFGMVGLVALLWLFYSQVRVALSSNDTLLKHLGVTLPILYFTICFGESYLLIHQTGLMFSVMSAFLYKNFRLSN